MGEKCHKSKKNAIFLACWTGLKLLNQHVEIKILVTKVGNPEFYEWLRIFIRLFAQLNYDQTYLLDQKSSPAIAYWNFRAAYKNEICAVKSSKSVAEEGKGGPQ